MVAPDRSLAGMAPCDAIGQRRLSELVLIAFDQARDQGDREVAEGLVVILDTMLTRYPQTADVSRSKLEAAVAMHRRP